MDYVTAQEVSAFNAGVPRGEEYPNPCFRCMCVWYCSASCKYGHRHHHALACHRHPAYYTSAELHALNTGVALESNVSETVTAGEESEVTPIGEDSEAVFPAEEDIVD